MSIASQTHEEAFTALAAAELRSYRQLPQIWYQISLKFRDEPRPRAGLMRVREFHMKDAYTFDLDAAGLDASFERMREAYERIFARCDVKALPARASSGAMGGRESIEFVVATSAGEDQVVRCTACAYVANVGWPALSASRRSTTRTRHSKNLRRLDQRPSMPSRRTVQCPPGASSKRSSTLRTAIHGRFHLARRSPAERTSCRTRRA